MLGANGAGKTTLLRVLAGLLRPHAGQARVLGRRAARPSAGSCPRRVGYLAHEPLLYRELSGRENLRYHARLHGVGRAPGSTSCSPPWGWSAAPTSRCASSRSGMVQRLAAARAVLHDPALLLLDEPRAGLDPAAAELLEPLIGRASGRTRVLVTHDVEGGLAEADLALGLRGGRQELAGRPAGRGRELYR